MRVHIDRPKEKRRKNAATKSNNRLQEEAKEEYFTVVEEEAGTETVFIDQVLLPQEVTQTVPQVESEKENEDELFNLQSYNPILCSTVEKCA